MTRPTLPGLVVVTAALSTLTAPAAAQERTDTTPAVAPAPADTTEWIAVHPRPRSSVSSVTITFPTGSAADAPGKGGTAWLLAATLEAMATEALGPDATVTVDADRNRVHATLLATPETWEAGLRTLTTVLFRRELDTTAFEARRRRLLNRMTFEAGAPVREFEAEAARLYSNGNRDWARTPEGDAESLQSLGIPDLDQYRRRNLLAEDAVVALVGPFDASDAGLAAGVLGTRGGGTLRGVTPTGSAPWVTGERLVEYRPITNTAVAFAYPLPAGHARTEAQFLAHVLRDRLTTDPPDPGVYSIETRVVDSPDGALLTVEATVFPDVGEAWESKIESVVAAVRATDTENDVYFPWQHRRFRATSLAGEAGPEDLGRRLTDDLLRQGSVRDTDMEIRGLTARKLVALAGALGAPRILFFGPDQSADPQP